MTQFEKDFIVLCLEGIKTILSDEDELQNAIRIFSNGKTNDPRYQLTSKITDSTNWTKDEKLKFSAAVFEATANATYAMCTNTDLTTETKDATTLLLDHYVPLVTTIKTASANKLDEVIQTCSLKKAELQNNHSADFSFDNPFVFFSTVAAGLVVVAAAVAFKNNG